MDTDLTPADVIPSLLIEGRGDYARGYNAGVEEIRALGPVTVRDMLILIRTRVHPWPGREVVTDYERGVSQAYSTWDLRWTHRRTVAHRDLDAFYAPKIAARRVASTERPFDPDDNYGRL